MSGVQTGYLYVSVAHMVFVSLQRQVSVLFADKTNESFSIPPPLSIEAQCSTPSIRHNTKGITATCKPHNVHAFNMPTTYLAILSPLKNRAMSWSDDCHGNPLALITVLSHTFSILLLHTNTHREGRTPRVDVELISRGIFILSKRYLPSSTLKLFTNSLWVRKRVACNRKSKFGVQT